MPFWKLWSTKSKENVRDENVDPQLVDHSDIRNKPHLNDPDEISSTFDQRHRSRNQMSVSRSGRYKQKQRKRVAIFDNPEFANHQQQIEKRKSTTEPDPITNGLKYADSSIGDERSAVIQNGRNIDCGRDSLMSHDYHNSNAAVQISAL